MKKGTVKATSIYSKFLRERSAGSERTPCPHSREKISVSRGCLKSAAIGAAAGFANGLFGAGGGSLLVPGMERFLGVQAHKAHATAIAVILPLSVISAFIYVRAGGVDVKALLFVCAGGLLGGFVGAKCLKKIPKRALHKLFGLFLVAAALRMIL